MFAREMQQQVFLEHKPKAQIVAEKLADGIDHCGIPGVLRRKAPQDDNSFLRSRRDARRKRRSVAEKLADDIDHCDIPGVLRRKLLRMTAGAGTMTTEVSTMTTEAST